VTNVDTVQPAIVLSIAGSDSGGGAGIQADLRTFAALGVHGTTVLSAVTAQNTLGVTGVSLLSETMVRAQLDAVLQDFDVAAVKTGMLASAEIIAVVGDYAKQGRLKNLVVDPVMVSTSNHELLAAGGVDAYRRTLLPHALLVTPNLGEACLLADVASADVTSLDDVTALGRAILNSGVRNVLVKGGHFGDDERSSVTDVLVSASGVIFIDGPFHQTTNTHGTGCSLSAAIATFLAQGDELEVAVRRAKAFVFTALVGASSWRIGRGSGPIDHLGWNR
jgi:hydroxymethylpyrimidine kinase/phosphomethylpyrimidine kinase